MREKNKTKSFVAGNANGKDAVRDASGEYNSNANANAPNRKSDVKMPPKPKFQDGEKVLCYHGPLLYEAKIMKNRKEPAPNKSGGGAAAAASSAADNSGGSYLVH